MRVRVYGGFGDLARDLRQVATQAPSDINGVVRRGVRVGATVARDLTKVRGGAHSGIGKKGVQPLVKSITSEMKVNGLGGLHAGEFGADETMKQARVMRVLEHGNATTPPKNIMADSADLMGPALHGEAKRLLDGWFWT